MNLDVRIKKVLRDFVLDVNFSTRDEIFALLGASGCGKSMTLKCIAGIETPDSGRIALNGRVLFDSDAKINLPPQLRRTGYLFQNYALFPNMTVAENILLAAVGTEAEQLKKLQENLSRFELTGLEKSYLHELSGGQQQRIAIARMFIKNPPIIFLDEPTASLDAIATEQIKASIDAIKKGRTVIIISHNIGQIIDADLIYVLQQGRVVQAGPPAEVYQQGGLYKDIFDASARSMNVDKIATTITA